jgi:hypothetical protein
MLKEMISATILMPTNNRMKQQIINIKSIKSQEEF